MVEELQLAYGPATLMGISTMRSSGGPQLLFGLAVGDVLSRPA